MRGEQAAGLTCGQSLVLTRLALELRRTLVAISMEESNITLQNGGSPQC